MQASLWKPVSWTAAGLVLAISQGMMAPAWGADAGDRWEEVRSRGEGSIRVLYVPSAHWAEKDADGELNGITVTLMRWFADWVGGEYGVDLAVDFVREEDWSVFYDRVRAAEPGVFGIGNVTITDGRRQELAFSPPYVANVAVGITHEEVPELASVDKLATTFEDLTALAFRDTLHEQRLRALRDEHVPDMDLVHAASNDEILERVAEGGYFAYIDAYSYWPARDAGKPLRHHPVLDDPGEHFGVILPQDTDWERIIREFFEADGGLKSRPEYRELLESRLGPEVADMLLGEG